jgi:hypothetical protein
VLLALLLVDAHLNESPLLLAELDHRRSRVLALLLALSELPAARKDWLRFTSIGVKMQRRDGKDRCGLRLFCFLDLCGQFGREHFRVFAPWIETGVLSEPFVKPPDRFEPLARVLRVAAERSEAAFQRFELRRGVERSQLERVRERERAPGGGRGVRQPGRPCQRICVGAAFAPNRPPNRNMTTASGAPRVLTTAGDAGCRGLPAHGLVRSSEWTDCEDSQISEAWFAAAQMLPTMQHAVSGQREIGKFFM